MVPDELVRETGCSREIAEDAAEHGYRPRLLRDNGLRGDAWRALFGCPGGVQALDEGAATRWSVDYSSAAWESIVGAAFGVDR